MHYELWDAQTSNVIAIVQTEGEGLALVRRLLSDGWNPDHLTLGQDFDEGEDGDDSTLPEVMYGAELAARATGSAGSRSVETPG
jgi:hypothetical protein